MEDIKHNVSAAVYTFNMHNTADVWNVWEFPF